MDYKETIQQMIADGVLAREDAAKYCPELIESEDEKIRKYLLKLAEKCPEDSIDFMGEVKKEDVIAWLEKRRFTEEDVVRAKREGYDVGCAKITGSVGRRGRQGGIAEDIRRDAEVCRDSMTAPYDSDDICTAYELGAMRQQREKEIKIVIPKFRVGDTIRPKGSMAEYTIESISGECYHGKWWELHISCDDDYELVEQKPA